MFLNRRGIVHARTVATSLYRFSSFQTSFMDKNIKGPFNEPSQESLVFNNAKEVFGHRSTRELIRAYMVLRACAVEPLVNRSYKLMKTGERILGPFLLSKLLSPFYFQFVVGDSEQQLRKAVDVMSSVGINLIICPLLETDIGETHTRSAMVERNFHKTLQLIEMSDRYRPKSGNLRPICLTKITAHINADRLTSINAAYENLSPDERSTLVQVIGDKMKKLSRSEFLPSTGWLKFPGVKIPNQDLKAVEGSLPRLVKIGQLSKEKKVILAVDAEFTYVNSAISLLTLPLMLAFNDDIPVIWNTYQAYLKNTKYWVEHDFEMMRSLGASFGAKIVRGAYMEREKEYAEETCRPCPVQDTYDFTNASYDSLINSMLSYVAANPEKYNLIVATHNEASINNAIRTMRLREIPSSSPSVVFGQTYGMAENISVPLSKAGYSVYKAVAYGSFTEVLPYLSRRAQENKGVLRGTRRERTLLEQELRRRFFKN